MRATARASCTRWPSDEPSRSRSSGETPLLRSGAAVMPRPAISKLPRGALMLPVTLADPDTVPPSARSGRTVLAIDSGTSSSVTSTSSGPSGESGTRPEAVRPIPCPLLKRAVSRNTLEPSSEPDASRSSGAMPALRIWRAEISRPDTSNVPRGARIVPSISAVPDRRPDRSSSGRAAFAIESGTSSSAT